MIEGEQGVAGEGKRDGQRLEREKRRGGKGGREEEKEGGRERRGRGGGEGVGVAR